MSFIKKIERARCTILRLPISGDLYYFLRAGEVSEVYRKSTHYWERRLSNWIAAANQKHNALVVDLTCKIFGETRRIAFHSSGVRERDHPEIFGFIPQKFSGVDRKYFVIYLEKEVELV